MRKIIMKKYTTTIIIIVVSIAIGLIIGLFFKGTSKDDHADHNHQSTAGEEVVWTCSMHPSIRQPEFGDCPICGMDLIPLANNENDGMDASMIHMSETAIKLADIRSAVVKSGNAVKSLNLNGILEKDERRVYTLASHIPGRVEELLLDFTGQRVKKGQVIAWVYSPELVTAQKELFEALNKQESQPLLVEASKAKLKNWKLSEEQIDQIIASGKPWDSIPVLAEKSGVITGKWVKRGDYIKQGQALYEVSDLSHLWMLLDVYEKDMAWIQESDSVFLNFTSLPGKQYTGTIDYIDPVLNVITRVAKARVNLSNDGGHLKPGLYGTGVVFSGQEELAGLPEIPASAVMWTGKRSLVYVRHSSETGMDFKMQNVTLGPKLDDSYIILEGLEVGEVIAINGTFSIDAAAQLSGKSSMMNPEGATFKSTHDHGDMDMAGSSNSHEAHFTPSVEKTHVSEDAKQALAPLYTIYLDLKDALVSDKKRDAKRKALELIDELQNIDMSLFEGDAHMVFMTFHDLILNHMPERKEMSDIEVLRTAFEYISDGMIGFTKAFSPLGETVYVQYCPMAFNNKGADWISRSEDIKNPYFGASMLTCGEIIDTLKIEK